ncbi:hypothetical protein LJC60_01115 [Ruminococcaceae bacterium OttesenSCG-928-D13]|nr:hypothetical protein [Ruminococcaceae bacterium OttesenSCG-928-D13]
MYKVERREKVTESFMLGDEVLSIEFIPSKMLPRYRDALKVLESAELKQIERRKSGAIPSDEELTEHGNAILEFVAATMGDENAQKVFAYFENDAEEMISQIYPFVVDVLRPRINQIANDAKAKRAAQYTGKPNRRQRRWFNKNKRS